MSRSLLGPQRGVVETCGKDMSDRGSRKHVKTLCNMKGIACPRMKVWSELRKKWDRLEMKGKYQVRLYKT